MTSFQSNFSKKVCAVFLLAFAAGCQTVSEGGAAISATPAAGLEHDARSPALYLSVIEQLILSDKSHAALAHLDEYERAYGKAPRARKLRADAKFALGSVAEAEADYLAISVGEYAGYGKHGLGRVAAARGNWELAVRNFREAVRIKPTSPEFLNDLGLALRQTGHFEEAEFNLRKAAELAPSNPAIKANLNSLTLDSLTLANGASDQVAWDAYPVTGVSAAIAPPYASEPDTKLRGRQQ